MSAVRLGTPGDARSLARLRYEFRAAINPAMEGEDSFVSRCSAWMALRLRPESDWRCWLIEGGGRITGNLWLQLIEKVPNPAAELEHHAYITNVYVSPGSRAGGAGEALLRTALDFCKQEQVDSVILWPTSRSRTLYARHGFAVRDDLMEAILDEGRHLG